jgi:hypothetical protein
VWNGLEWFPFGTLLGHISKALLPASEATGGIHRSYTLMMAQSL